MTRQAAVPETDTSVDIDLLARYLLSYQSFFKSLLDDYDNFARGARNDSPLYPLIQALANDNIRREFRERLFGPSVSKGLEKYIGVLGTEAEKEYYTEDENGQLIHKFPKLQRDFHKVFWVKPSLSADCSDGRREFKRFILSKRARLLVNTLLDFAFNKIVDDWYLKNDKEDELLNIYSDLCAQTHEAYKQAIEAYETVLLDEINVITGGSFEIKNNGVELTDITDNTVLLDQYDRDEYFLRQRQYAIITSIKHELNNPERTRYQNIEEANKVFNKTKETLCKTSSGSKFAGIWTAISKTLKNIRRKIKRYGFFKALFGDTAELRKSAKKLETVRNCGLFSRIQYQRELQAAQSAAPSA